MHIESVRVSFPSRQLSNADIVELVRQNSEGTLAKDLPSILERISRYLVHSGAETRYWLDRSKAESPISLIMKAANEALLDAKLSGQDIDLLVYVGVDRGFQEPGNSQFVAKALGMYQTHCFDILDACMSWSRALLVISSLFKCGVYRRAMIVNGEFNQTHVNGPGFPKLFSIRSNEQVEWTWPGYTVGEAASATILSSEPASPWEFFFSSRTDWVDLCNIPMKGYEGYCADLLRGNGPDQFTSFGKEMHAQGTLEVVKILERLLTKIPVNDVRAIFPHASSKKAWDEAATILGVQQLLYHVYPRYGNVVSASIPAGLALAIAENKIKRGDRLIGWVGSSGMSFAAYSFVY